MRRPIAIVIALATVPALVHCVGSDPNPTSAPDASTNGSDAGSTNEADGSTTATNDSGTTEEDAGPKCPETPCTNQACVNGVCKGVCEPGKVQCSGNAVQTCEASGQWGTPSECVSSTCNDGKCTGACSAGQTECSGNALMGCDGGTWDSPVACGDKTCCGNASAKSCQGSCAPGQTQCSGNAVQTCGTCGAWSAAVACSASETCIGSFPTAACGGVCGPGQTRCFNNAPQTCSAGQWTGSSTCINQTCVNAQCVGVCAPGQKQCKPGSGTTPQTCGANGQWVDGVPCSATRVCQSGNCVNI